MVKGVDVQAFELKPAFEDFSGGTIKANMSGAPFDVKKALDDGGGIIVTDDPGFATLLANYEPLAAVPQADIPPDAKPVEVPGQEAILSAVALPWISQDPSSLPPAPVVPEIPAVHADPPVTVDDDLKAGERVSGGASLLGAGTLMPPPAASADSPSETSSK